MNAIYVVYKMRKYDNMEHFSCGIGDNHHGICFLKDENKMRVQGTVGDRKPD